jgi:transposase-like protein
MDTAGNVLTGEHGDYLREALRKMLREVMASEVTALCGAATGVRSDERVNSRNGYRERALETRLGTLPLEIPKLRHGSYFPSFLAPRRRWEQAFVNVVSEAYVLGVSTRKVEGLVEAMGARGMSRSEVSRMAEVLDAEVTAFRERSLEERSYPYLWLDALFLKVRVNKRVTSRAVLVAYGVNRDGEREIIGVSVAPGEMATAWKAFLASLVERGLHGVQLVISDAHAGLRKAIHSVLNGCSWQRCTVHFLRDVMSHLPRSAQTLAGAALKNIFKQPTEREARDALKRAIALLDEHHPAAAEVVRLGEDDVLTYMSFPEKHWRQLHSTNPLERQNKEIRRRTDVVGIFPSEASALRLVAMLLIEQNDEWAVGKRYFSRESMGALVTPEAVEPKTKAA